MNLDFSTFDRLEDTPVSLMEELTDIPPAQAAETKANDFKIDSLADHTKVQAITEPLQPGNNLNTGLPGNSPQPQRMNAGSLITGDMAVGFMDLLLPIIIVLVIDKVSGKKVNKRSLQATADEKKIIAPILQNYLNSINFNVDSPLNALLITLAMIYGTKTIEVLNTPEPPAGFRTPSPVQQQQQQQVKRNSAETRGRHKLNCNCDKCRQKRG